MWSVPSGSERRILRKSSSVACGIFASGPLVRTFTITVRILMTRCIWLSRPGNGSNRKSRPLGRLFFVFCTSTRQRGESRRIYHLPHGGGWRPPGRPGAALGSWWPPGKGRAVWYHLPHGSGRQPPGRPGAALGSWAATRGGKSSGWYISPWRRPAAARPTRSSPGELGGHQESEDRQEILISPTLIMAPNIDKGHKARG